MRNIKLTIEYDGTNYAGWQIQNSRQASVFNRQRKTIQEVIEKTLQKILQGKIRLIASGRTDAGVHAQAQVANFKTNSKILLGKLQKALNALLPEDIAITKDVEVSPDFHARFAVKSKIYRYTILNRRWRSALLKDKVYFYPYPLNINLMRKASRCLLGRHDFKSFCASGSDTKNTVRTIKRLTVRKLPCQLSAVSCQPKDFSLIVIDIEANGFLYNMVRNIVGTLIEVGRGKFQKGTVKKILLAKNRKLAGPTAPAKGLLLVRVKY